MIRAWSSALEASSLQGVDLSAGSTPRPAPAEKAGLLRRAAAVVAVVAGSAVLLVGCAAQPAATLTIQPRTVAPDQPVHVSMKGLDPGATVTLKMSTSPSSGKAWSSSATFKASAGGTISTDQAPVHGDYAGVRPDGLEEALHAPRGDTAPGFSAPTSSPWRLQVRAIVNGKAVAHGSATRRLCFSSVTVHRLTLAHNHLDGYLYEPKQTPTNRGPGIVTIGGSGGGYGSYLAACDLAAAGIPALSVAYFHEPGLPDQLQRIPLEYFATAARILAEAPGVDPDKVVLWGDSRGSEAAALTAIHYRTLIHGAVLTVPDDVVLAAPSAPSTPAWTFRGRPVTTQGLGAALSDPSAAALAVEQINGPVLAVCAGKDAVWPSCPQSDGLRTRLQDHGNTSRFTLLNYPKAGHFAGSLTPYYPTTATSTLPDLNTVTSGGTPLADAEARDDAFPQLLAWLHHL